MNKLIIVVVCFACYACCRKYQRIIENNHSNNTTNSKNVVQDSTFLRITQKNIELPKYFFQFSIPENDKLGLPYTFVDTTNKSPRYSYTISADTNGKKIVKFISYPVYVPCNDSLFFKEKFINNQEAISYPMPVLKEPGFWEKTKDRVTFIVIGVILAYLIPLAIRIIRKFF